MKATILIIALICTILLVGMLCDIYNRHPTIKPFTSSTDSKNPYPFQFYQFGVDSMTYYPLY